MKGLTQIRIVLTACLSLLLAAPAMAKPPPGNILFERTAEESEAGESTIFPAAIFPHWSHRILYRCDACHDSLFKMEQGATPVTMALMGKGEVCGACHNGEIAFGSDFVSCARCHQPPAK